jgi:toxin ParE1/3/4
MPAANRRLIWSPAAKSDLREIWRYFVNVASRDVADQLLRNIQGAGARVRRRPLAWRTRDEVFPELRSILVHPYVIFYRVENETVEVVRVLHQRRNFAALFPKADDET